MEIYSLKNNIEKVLRGQNTSFLNPIDTKYVINYLNRKNQNYKIFRLFDEAEKLIVYKNKVNITLFEIKTSDILTHKEILGTLFSHNLSEDTFGDIIISDKYYIVVLESLKNYMLFNFNKIGKKRIELIEKNLEEVKDFKPSFKDININAASLRIDNVISKLIPTSRTISNELIFSSKVMVNYQTIKSKTYSLKEEDIFSIKGIGKFKLEKITSKNNKYNLLIKKYI